MDDSSDDIFKKIKDSLLPEQQPTEVVNTKAMEETLGRMGIKRDDPSSAEYFRLLDGMTYAKNNIPNRQPAYGPIHALAGAGSAGMLAWAGDSNPQRYNQQFIDQENKRRTGIESEGVDFVDKVVGPAAMSNMKAKIDQQLQALKQHNLAVSLKIKSGKIYNTYGEMAGDQGKLHPAGTAAPPAAIQRTPAVPGAKIPNGPPAPVSGTPGGTPQLPGTTVDMGGMPAPGQPVAPRSPAAPAAVGGAQKTGVTSKYDQSALPPFTVPYSDEDLAALSVYGDDKAADNARQTNDQARKNYEIVLKQAEQVRAGQAASPEEKAALAAAQKRGEGLGDAQVALSKAHEDTLAFLANSEKLLADKNLGLATGFVGGRTPEIIQSEKRAGVQSRISQLQGEIFLNAFNSIKGAGAITEAEGAQAKAAMGRLGTQTMGTKEYAQAVRDAQNSLVNKYNIARQKAGQPPVSLQEMMQSIDPKHPSGRKQPGAEAPAPGGAPPGAQANGDPKEQAAATPKLAVPPEEFVAGVRADYAAADDAGKKAILGSLKRRGIDPAQVLGGGAPQPARPPAVIEEGGGALERQVQGNAPLTAPGPSGPRNIPEGATMVKGGVLMIYRNGKWERKAS